MTRARMYGEDTPFGDWLRRNRRIDSVRDAVTVNDVDYQFHKYRTNVDGVGTRDVHLCMNMELKTFNCLPNDNQRQTLFFNHQLLDKRLALKNSQNGGRVAVWHFGYYVLSIPGTYPGEIGDTLTWYRFSDRGHLIPSVLSIGQLEDVLAFRLNPLTLVELSLRRHHKTTYIISSEKTPLGFETEKVITRRS